MKNSGSFIRQIYNKCLFASLIALLCGTLGSIANSLIIGNMIGVEQLTVTSLVLPIYYVFATAGNLLGIGGSTVASMRMGKDDFVGAKKAFVSTYLLLIIASAIFTALTLVFLPQIVSALGTPPELYDDTMGYAAVMAIGGVFTGGVYLSFNFLRLDGRTTSSFIVFILMAAVNIISDLVFIFCTDLGMTGVSLATSLGAATATIFGAVMLFFKPNTLGPAKVEPREFGALSGEIIRIGSPGAVENISILLRSFLLNLIVLNSFGTLAMSALTVTGSINSFAVSIIAGVAGTIVPFVGVFGAERDTVSIRQVLKLAVLQGSVMTLLFSAACILFAPNVAAVFGMSDAASLKLAVPAIKIFCLSLIGSQINNIFISLHLSNGRTALSNFITALRNVVIIVPTAYFLSGYTALGLDGIWHAYWVTELITLIITIVTQLVLSSHDRKLSKVFLLDDSAEKDGTLTSFSVANSEEAVMECVDKISEFCETNNLTRKSSMLISLSLEEMLNLIRVHCLKENADLTVNIRIVLYGDVIILRLRNGGVQFNPLQYYKERMASAKDDDIDAMLELGDSLGIKMILDTTDSLDYRRTFGVNNLTVTIDNSKKSPEKSRRKKLTEADIDSLDDIDLGGLSDLNDTATDIKANSNSDVLPEANTASQLIAESKGNIPMPENNTSLSPSEQINRPIFKVKITAGEHMLNISSLREEDIAEVAQLYRDIQINKSNYKRALSSSDERSFNKIGGMFLIFDEDDLRRLIDDKSSLVVTARDESGKIVSSIWFSLHDPHFEDKESIYFFSGFEETRALIGAASTIIGREIIVSEKNTFRRTMQYTNAIAQRFLFDLGYRDVFAEIYGSTGYSDADGEVHDELFNHRSYRTIEKFNGEYIGNFRPRTLKLDGFSVTIAARAYHWKLADSVSLLEKNIRDDGSTVEWFYGK